MKVWYVLQACYMVLVILASIKGDYIVAVLYQICLLIAFAVPDLSGIAGYFKPPYHSRFEYDDTIGFRLDEENCPLCPKCLAESKATPGTYKSRRTLVCPIHGEVTGANAVSKKTLKRGR